MNREASQIAWGLAFVVCACSRGPAPFEVAAVEPASISALDETAVVLRGGPFRARVRADLDQPNRSEVDAVFVAQLSSAGGSVSLMKVSLASETELTAMVPAGLAPGMWTLAVTDPYGRTATLPSAIEVEVPPKPNTSPMACLKVIPAWGTPATSFELDAQCSADAEDPASVLQARFDPEGSGAFQGWSADRTSTHVFAAPAVYHSAVEIMDSGGLISFAFAWVVVSISADGVIVTTAEDEDDPVSDLSNPGGTGLSLREAIRYVNDQGGSKTISFAGPMTIDTGANGPLPAVTSNAVQVVGLPGVTIDFAGTGAEGTCFMLEGANGMAINLDLARCAGTAIEIGGNSNQVLGCTLRKGEGTASVGARLTGTGAVFGPENEVWGWGAGVEMKSTANLVDGNRIRGNNTGIFVDSGRGGIVQRNAIFANTGAGVALASREQEAQIRHNTIDGNQGDGLNAPGNAEDLEVCNNLFTHNAGHGISGPGHAFVGRDPNGFFDNLQGNFSSGTPDSSSVVADPLYTDRAAGDFRLKEGSLAIDKGIDDGVDMNGARASNYNGEAPDLGGFESL